MKPLTLSVIATTGFLILTTACTHRSMEPAATMENSHPLTSMKAAGSMDGSMGKSHDGVMMDKPMMETPAEER